MSTVMEPPPQPPVKTQIINSFILPSMNPFQTPLLADLRLERSLAWDVLFHAREVYYAASVDYSASDFLSKYTKSRAAYLDAMEAYDTAYDAAAVAGYVADSVTSSADAIAFRKSAWKEIQDAVHKTPPQHKGYSLSLYRMGHGSPSSHAQLRGLVGAYRMAARDAHTEGSHHAI